VAAFVAALRARGAAVATGRFRAHMLVESVNVGPRTVLLEL
jgi:D-tyrosyl-tRNA(Tyr) deacylase